MVIVVLAAIGALVVLAALVDLTDYLFVRAGKPSVFRWRPIPTRDILGPTSAAGGKDGPSRHAQDLTG
jgi:hypothetical protein